MTPFPNPRSQPKKPLSDTGRWRLWVDGCGGFLLLTGDRWSLGGIASANHSDIMIQADWPRNAGMISRQEDHYVWTPNQTNNEEKPALIEFGKVIPVAGSAKLRLVQPNPLSPTAVLMLEPPHRFADHVDGVILADQTILIGPAADCHARGTMLTGKVLLVHRSEGWFAKAVGDKEFVKLLIGERTELAEVGMTLENA
ncbi:hypothetical protein Q31b_26980 [Novipirellula aureliae]|uniref:Uncharacterized protein n=1 Tax=Novipirellula aureliae TaxID=2527966 RepID=A0A5C6E287_9BACT|nr:hypothetical protein [Novipirellula aureliae]TWU41259.1 hypothetical protein Q31b_26980 [Novipirellula aureliae]